MKVIYEIAAQEQKKMEDKIKDAMVVFEEITGEEVLDRGYLGITRDRENKIVSIEVESGLNFWSIVEKVHGHK